MKPTARRLLSLSLFLVVVALLGGAAGFLYAHDPQREMLTITLDAAPPTDPHDSPLGGTVIDASGGRLRLDTAKGPIDVALPATVRIEELRSLPLAGLTPGSVVNVGIERSDSSTAISGIVALEPR